MSQPLQIETEIEECVTPPGEAPGQTDLFPESIAGLQAALREEFSAPVPDEAAAEAMPEAGPEAAPGVGHENIHSKFTRAANSHASRLDAFCESSIADSDMLRQSVSALCSGMADIAARTEQDVSAIQAQIELSKSALALVTADVAQGRERLIAAENGAKNIDEALEENRQAMLRVTTLQSSVDALSDSVTSINEKLTIALKAVDRLATHQAQEGQVAAKVQALQAAIGGLSELFERERAQRELLVERLSLAESKLGEFQARDDSMIRWQRRVNQAMHQVIAP